MSEPNEIRRELLSAFLDDAASPDESARVEQMLRDDPTVRQELDAMRQLRAELSQFSEDNPRLDDGFFDRVWAATTAQADDVGLAPEHPVRRAQAAADRSDSSSRMAWVGVLAALAASVMLVIALSQGDQGQDGPIAESVPDETIDEHSNVVEPAVEIASVDRDIPEPMIPDAQVTPIEDTDIAIPDSNEPRIEVVVKDPDLPTPAPDVPMPDSTLKLRVAMLLKVALTKRGEEVNELQFAFESAGIDLREPRDLTREQLTGLHEVKAVGRADIERAEDAEGNTQLLFVRAPAKRIDDFILSLYNKPSKVKSVGMTLISEPNLVQALADATRVPSNASSVIQQPNSESLGNYLRFGGRSHFPASDRKFMTMSSDQAKSMKLMPLPRNDQGPDFMRELLVLVESPQ